MGRCDRAENGDGMGDGANTREHADCQLLSSCRAWVPCGWATVVGSCQEGSSGWPGTDAECFGVLHLLFQALAVPAQTDVMLAATLGSFKKKMSNQISSSFAAQVPFPERRAPLHAPRKYSLVLVPYSRLYRRTWRHFRSHDTEQQPSQQSHTACVNYTSEQFWLCCSSRLFVCSTSANWFTFMRPDRRARTSATTGIRARTGGGRGRSRTDARSGRDYLAGNWERAARWRYAVERRATRLVGPFKQANDHVQVDLLDRICQAKGGGT